MVDLLRSPVERSLAQAQVDVIRVEPLAADDKFPPSGAGRGTSPHLVCFPLQDEGIAPGKRPCTASVPHLSFIYLI